VDDDVDVGDILTIGICNKKKTINSKTTENENESERRREKIATIVDIVFI
jgi:hypothetical protein